MAYFKKQMNPHFYARSNLNLQSFLFIFSFHSIFLIYSKKKEKKIFDCREN